MAKVLLFTALILSIVVPFRMYFKGERSKRRYKISLAVNALAFFGLMLGAGLVIFGGNAFAAENAGAAAAAAGTATGLGYLAAGLSIGLSCVALEAVETTAHDGTVLRVRGADLMDGTPILDIKPYLPYGDCRPEATGGFASAPAAPALTVDIPPHLLERVPPERREALTGVLALDPRPHYQDDPERVYGFVFAGLEVRFSVAGDRLTVREIGPAAP